MKRIHFFALIAALLLSAGASAQSFRTGYFLDNYVYGYHINPAQVNQKSFIALGLGNTNLQQTMNYGVANFVFPTANGVVTGFNKAVTAEQFIGAMPERLTLTLDESFNILSFGVADRKNKAMHTFELNVRALGTIALPRDLFAFLKQGGDRTYDISGINVNMGGLADIAYGYSRHIGSKLTVGGRVHLLLGVANANIYTENSNITVNASQATVNEQVNMQISGILTVGTDENGKVSTKQIGMKGDALGGFGVGLDLGAEYQPIDGLKVMLSITDLGFISWKNSTDLVSSNQITYTGSTITYDESGVKMDGIQGMVDKLKEAMIFKPGNTPNRTSMMPMNIALGARYNMFFYKPLSAGMLGTFHIDGVGSWYDLRAGITFTPAYIFSITGSLGFGTFGGTWGAAMNLHLGPLNLRAGLDSFMGRIGKVEGIPAPLDNLLLNANMGIGFTF
ncbi:MAG: hypothetical protein J5646_00590 [Bacteroidales bacterium]|nr:hypothetical protein [Bacteroidales bacterium]